MSRSLALLRDSMTAIDLARRSCAWDRVTKGDAELTIAVPTAEAIVLGAFQRPSEVLEEPALTRLRRGSGGGAARIGPGTVWMQLALTHPGALVPCTADKLLNRYVRPLLRALTRATRVPAHYFGRDWISASHRPIALVSFAHEAATGKSLFEAMVSVNRLVTISSRSSFRGRPPATCDEISRRAVEPAAVVEAIVDAYAAEATELLDVGRADVAFATSNDAVVASTPAWVVVCEEAIGILAAGTDAAGRIEIGGELMASRDAMTRLRDALATLPSGATPDDIGRVVDDAMTAHGAITFGVRSLASIRDAIVDARMRETRSQ